MFKQTDHTGAYASEPSSPNEASGSGSLLIGKVVAINDHGNPMVSFNQATQKAPVEALTTVPLDASSINKDVAISFAQNQNSAPIVMGVIRRVLDDVMAQQSMAEHSMAEQEVEPASAMQIDEIVEETALTEQRTLEEGKPEIIVDGNKLELSAADEITLRCGKSSITLNKNGKILVKGEHMLNRASGSYKIKSGSIQLN